MGRDSAKPLRLLLVGATGAVGQQVLAAALANPRIAQVIAPSRRPLPAHAKLHAPVIDFAHLPADAPWWQVDAVICTLGTTIKAAGSQQAFAAVDRDLPIQLAGLARQAGATGFVLNSSARRDSRRKFLSTYQGGGGGRNPRRRLPELHDRAPFVD